MKKKTTTKQKFIVRCDRAGVFYGEIESKTKDIVVMKNVQKVFYWDGACAVEELAKYGSTKPSNCKLTVVIDTLELNQWIQIIPCTKESINILDNIAIWKKS